jgi:hypothetical protein
VSSTTYPKASGHRSMIGPCPRLLAALLASLTLGSVADPAKTQSPDRLNISMAAVAATAGARAPFTIRVGPAASIPRNSFVRVRGLPATAALSDGHAIAPGIWAVPLHALAGLTLVLPGNVSGKVEILVTLVALDGSVLDEAKSSFVIHEAAPRGADAQFDPPATPRTKILSTQTPPSLPSERAEGNSPSLAILPPDHERALKLFKQGEKQMVQGNIAAARLVYELAAEEGLAQAAMALAATYDAAELARVSVRGIQPNVSEAKRWYERARQLGATEADQHLRRLGAN